MIRRIEGEYLSLNADNEGVIINAGHQIMRLHYEAFAELAKMILFMKASANES